MPSHRPFSNALTDAQRARIARRRQQFDALADSKLDTQLNTQPDARLLDDLQRTINTQLNGIIGVLEMIRQNDLAADQRELIDLAQRSADNLLSDASHLLGPDIDDTVKVGDFLIDIRILIVSPDVDMRSRIEKALAQHGMLVAGFDRADTALAALNRAAGDGDPYRIALLDQNLPGIDGETLGTAIGAASIHRDTLIVLASGEHGRHDADRLAQAGFSAWLPKPVSPPMLVDTLTLLCNCIVKKDAPRFVCAGMRLTSEHAVTDTTYSFAQARILVVDDNQINLQVAERMLARFGCCVDTASGGRQALHMTDVQRYDLILMDCQMPDLDGYQTTALLRAAEDGRTHTPIVGWSARTNRNERDTCLAIGMDDFIAKPMRIRPLNEILVRWLRQSVADETVACPDDELDTTQEMFGDDFAELAQLFRHDSPKRLVSLREAVLADDAVAIAKLAHVLCGSSASLGATTLAALCRELEISVKNGMLNEGHPRLAAIEIEYARIDARLSGMLQGDTQDNSSSSR